MRRLQAEVFSQFVSTLTPPPKCKVLRPYQPRPIDFVVDSDDHICIEYPTGSGKTIIIVATCQKLFALEKSDGIIVATLMEHIEHSFTKRDYVSYGVIGKNAKLLTHLVPETLMQAARAEGSSRKSVREYLRKPQKNALVATHMCLTGLTGKDLPRSLVGKILMVDEAQQAPASELAKVIAIWIRRGGRVVYYTATAYRLDNKPVLFPGMRILRRSLVEHMAEGYAPPHIRSVIVPIGHRNGVPISTRRFYGEIDPSDLDAARIARAMGSFLESEGFPKTVIRVPPVRGGTGVFIAAIKRELSRLKLSVYDATGETKAQQKAFLEMLESERSATISSSKYDVIVGIQRVGVGTDWPLCSHVLHYGMCRSAPFVKQFLGRATRQKDKSHPHKDAATIAFFVETNEGETLDLLERRHSEDALALTCLLADTASPAEWELRKAMYDAIDENIKDEQWASDMRAELDGVAIDLRKEAEALLQAAVAMDGKKPAIVEEVEQVLAAVTKDSQDPSVAQGILAKLIYDGANEKDKGRIRDTITRVTRALTKGFASQFPMTMVRGAAFEAVIALFRKETMQRGPIIQGLTTKIHALSAKTMAKFAQSTLGTSALTEAMIRSWGNAFKDVHDRYPIPSDIPTSLPEGETWKGIDSDLRLGQRCLPGGSSLRKFFSNPAIPRVGHDPDAPLNGQVWGLLLKHRDGLTSKQVAEALHLRDNQQASSHLSALAGSGFVRKMPGGLWRTTSKRNGPKANRTLIDNDQRIWQALQSFLVGNGGVFTSGQLAEATGKKSGGASSPALKSLRKRGIVHKHTNGWVVDRHALVQQMARL